MQLHSMCQPGRPDPSFVVVPPRLPVAGGPPQERVEGVTLAGPIRVAAPLGEDRHHLLAVPVGDRAEPGVLGEVEVDVVRDRLRGGDPVGHALLEELGHRRRDGADALDHPDVVVRRDDREVGHVLAEEGDLGRGQVLPVQAVALGPLDQRVVDVGDVLDVLDAVTGVAQCPPEHVEGHIGRGMTEVGGVVGRDAADVHPRRRPGGDGPDSAGRGVEDAHRQARARHGRDEGGRPRDHGCSLRAPLRAAATGWQASPYRAAGMPAAPGVVAPAPRGRAARHR